MTCRNRVLLFCRYGEICLWHRLWFCFVRWVFVVTWHVNDKVCFCMKRVPGSITLEGPLSLETAETNATIFSWWVILVLCICISLNHVCSNNFTLYVRYASYCLVFTECLQWSGSLQSRWIILDYFLSRRILSGQFPNKSGCHPSCTVSHVLSFHKCCSKYGS